MRCKKIYFILSLLTIIFWGCRSSILDDPSTNINFDVPETSHVKLTVENSYNTVVQTPVDGVKQTGAYSVQIQIMNEGVYFYTLELKGVNSNFYFKLTRKILIVK